MTVNERLKCLRKKLNLSQTAFGEKVEIAQGHMTNIETGRRELTEKNIKLICIVFNVNEHWLRTGEGEMFIENDNTILSELSKQHNLSNMDEVFFRTFLKCSPEERAVLKQVAFRLMDAVTEDKELYAEYQRTKEEYPIDDLPIAAATEVLDEKELTYEQKKQIFLAEFEAQEKMKKSSAITGTNGINEKIG